jgi:hypothetical protein
MKTVARLLLRRPAALLAGITALWSAGSLPAADLFLRDGAAANSSGELALVAGGTAATDTIPSAGGVKSDGTPRHALVYLARGLTGTYTAGGATQFALHLDAYAKAGTAAQARVSYDFTGDGTWDRVETYRYYAVNNVANWEKHTETIRDGLRTSSGVFANLNGGAVKLELWSALGNAPIDVRTDAPTGSATCSFVRIPFDLGVAPTTPTAPVVTPPPAPVVAPPAAANAAAAGTLYLQPGATEFAPGALSATPCTGASADLAPAAGGQKYDLQPHRALVYRATGLNGAYTAGGITQFHLFADAGNTGQNAIQARVSYDFTGDGTWDRVDHYHYYALNDVANWEDYAHDARDGLDYATGSFAALANGTVQVELWAALGNASPSIRVGATEAQGQISRLVLPYTFGSTSPGGSTGGGNTGGDTGGGDTGGNGGGTNPPPTDPVVADLAERFRQVIGNLGQGTGSSSHPGTAEFPASILAPANTPGYGAGYSPANALSDAQLSTALADGLAAWRRPGNHGSCASCHSPDGYDLALIAYDNPTIIRRALDHVSQDDANRIVELVRAQRQLYAIERPLDPLKFRPLQPTGELLPGATPEQRDQAFGQLLANDVKLIWATRRIETRADALAAQAQLRDLDLRKLPIGVPFDRWSEDAARGTAHRSGAEWLPGMGVQPKSGRAAEWYALHDAYLIDPSDAKFWAYYSRIDQLLESVEPAGHELGFQWSLLKYKSVQIAQHMWRHRALAFPNPLVNQTGDAVANRALLLARNPLFRTGDHLRRFPLYDDPAKPITTFPAHVAATLPTTPAELRAQTEQFFRAWFWMGWVYDPALLLSDEIFQTVEGDYLYASLLADYKLHHAFVVAKTSVAKAGATAWFNATGPGVRGHGKWASFTPFMVLHHIERNRNEPGAGDVRRAQHDLMFSNTARLWIHLVHEDLERTGTVYDRNLVRGAIRFARQWLNATEPGVDHTALDAVIADLEQRLTAARELRTDFTTEDLSNALPF